MRFETTITLPLFACLLGLVGDCQGTKATSRSRVIRGVERADVIPVLGSGSRQLRKRDIRVQLGRQEARLGKPTRHGEMRSPVLVPRHGSAVELVRAQGVVAVTIMEMVVVALDLGLPVLPRYLGVVVVVGICIIYRRDGACDCACVSGGDAGIGRRGCERGGFGRRWDDDRRQEASVVAYCEMLPGACYELAR